MFETTEIRSFESRSFWGQEANSKKKKFILINSFLKIKKVITFYFLQKTRIFIVTTKF